MYPVLELPQIGVTVRSHGLLVAVAAVLACVLAYRWTVRVEGLPRGKVVLVFAGLALLAFSGGRLHYLLASGTESLSFFRLTSAGLHAPGAVLAVSLGALLLPWLVGLPIGRFVDGLAPAVAVGIAVARVGCFLHGCCFGKMCSVPWGVAYPAKSYVYALQVQGGLIAPTAARSLPVHPLPLYFSLAAILLAATLIWWRSRRQYAGQLGIIFLVIFSLSSTGLEVLRVDLPDRSYWGGFPQLLWVGLMMSALSVTAAVVLQRKLATAVPEKAPETGTVSKPSGRMS